MELLIITLSSIIVIGVFLIWYISTYNNYQNFIIRINEVEANIDSTLRKRFDLLNKSIAIIKANCNIEEEVLEIIVKLRSRKISNFDLDRELYTAINEFNSYGEKYEELKTCKPYVKIDVSLHESEAEIEALRKYYNDVITDYNKLIRTFPSKMVGSMSNLKEKTYFDGKDMNDEIYDDFKL